MYDWIKPRRPKAVDAGIQAAVEHGRHVSSMLDAASLGMENIAEADLDIAKETKDVATLIKEAGRSIVTLISDLEKLDGYFGAHRAADNIRFRRFRQGDQD